ncbi:hypothetical protein M752DRAFT_267503 [Aspergillus phoenicis ATCC 13157]|uniref:Uncharacterized protein n=1 Tax=Aspergillus phoenicis ATCC 13157 TaxID=1353007 RepID=A0A370PG87_ASPPH|nr:hypothetical protein M752DRAFT_267503 [Aspergillus phoenicis ATCC 13157]
MAISRYPLRGCGVSIRPSIEGLAQALFERLVFFFCSLVPDVCRYPFEGVVYLSRYRVSLREFDGLLVLVPALFEGLVALSQPLSPSGVRFILADIGEYTCLFASIMPCQHTDDNISVSLREFDGLLNLVNLANMDPSQFSERIWSSTSCSSSLRESGLQPLAVSPRESGLLLVCSCTETTASFCLRLSTSVNVRHVSTRDRRPIPLAVTEARIPLFAGLPPEYLVSEGRQPTTLPADIRNRQNGDYP